MASGEATTVGGVLRFCGGSRRCGAEGRRVGSRAGGTDLRVRLQVRVHPCCPEAVPTSLLTLACCCEGGRPTSPSALPCGRGARAAACAAFAAGGAGAWRCAGPASSTAGVPATGVAAAAGCGAPCLPAAPAGFRELRVRVRGVLRSPSSPSSSFTFSSRCCSAAGRAACLPAGAGASEEGTPSSGISASTSPPVYACAGQRGRGADSARQTLQGPAEAQTT